MIYRSTYSVLDWIGDIGGLFDGLYAIGRYFVAPAAHFTVQAKLLSTLYSFIPKDKDVLTTASK